MGKNGKTEGQGSCMNEAGVIIQSSPFSERCRLESNNARAWADAFCRKMLAATTHQA